MNSIYMPMMFYTLSCVHLITVINKHSNTSRYKVNWDKSKIHPLLYCKYDISWQHSPGGWTQKLGCFIKGSYMVSQLHSVPTLCCKHNRMENLAVCNTIEVKLSLSQNRMEYNFVQLLCFCFGFWPHLWAKIFSIMLHVLIFLTADFWF